MTTQGKRKNPAIKAGIMLVVVLLLVLAYVQVLNIYQNEQNSRTCYFSTGDSSQPDLIEIGAQLLSVDAVTGFLNIRLTFTPSGALASPDGVTIAQDLTLDVNTAVGKTEVLFKKGERMNPTDAVLALEGQVTDYPFDRHTAVLELVLSGPELGVAAPGSQDSPMSLQRVPFTLYFSGAVSG